MRIESKPMQALRKIALQYPEAEEGTSCNKAAFKARNKAFLFVGMDQTSYNVMLKLRESLPEAARLAAKEPNHYGVGGMDWVKATFSHNESPPAGLMEKWIDESYRLLVHKQLVALLPERGLLTRHSTKAAKKKIPKKQSAKKATR
jgi:hypothetical protein